MDEQTSDIGPHVVGPQGIGSDPDAFERFYREHIDTVLRFVTRRVDDPYLAADLTAEIFLAVIESAESYRSGRGTPIAWLHGIARNVVAGHQRRRARERNAVARLAGRRHLGPDDIERMEERIDAAGRARRLYTAMSGLGDGERAVLELVAVDGLTVGDAAAALRIGPVVARVRLHRARRRLQSEIELPTSTKPSEVMR